MQLYLSQRVAFLGVGSAVGELEWSSVFFFFLYFKRKKLLQRVGIVLSYSGK